MDIRLRQKSTGRFISFENVNWKIIHLIGFYEAIIDEVDHITSCRGTTGYLSSDHEKRLEYLRGIKRGILGMIIKILPRQSG